MLLKVISYDFIICCKVCLWVTLLLLVHNVSTCILTMRSYVGIGSRAKRLHLVIRKSNGLITDSILDILIVHDIVNRLIDGLKLDIRVDGGPNKWQILLLRCLFEHWTQQFDKLHNFFSILSLLDKDVDILFNGFDVFLDNFDIFDGREIANKQLSINLFLVIVGLLQEDWELFIFHVWLYYLTRIYLIIKICSVDN